jgi:hypothetical protein
MSQVLLIELKRGGSEITREHVHRTSDYIEDFLTKGLIDGKPTFKAYVVGHSISRNVEPIRNVGDRGKICVTTFNSLVRLTNLRLFRLKDRPASRYDEVSGTELLTKVLAEPEQLRIGTDLPN